MSQSYGLHLLIDAYRAPADKLSDERLLKKVLRELPDLIGMRRVGPPRILRVEEVGIAGLSGFTFIMESHVSVHTYSERGFVTIDVYSCKHFDKEAAFSYLKDAFCFEDFEEKLVERGRRFKELSSL